jgi:hypothetical protein
MMMKNPINITRPGGRVPKLHPAAQPGWYKRFRQLTIAAGKTLRVTTRPTIKR